MDRSLLVLAMFIAVAQAGCFSWEPVAFPVPEQAPLGYVRLVQLDGEDVRLARTHLTPDSLSGRRAGVFTTRRISIPIDSVQSLERRRTDWLRSAGAVALGLAGAALSVLFAPPFG